jgi:hypothetical protein
MLLAKHGVETRNGSWYLVVENKYNGNAPEWKLVTGAGDFFVNGLKPRNDPKKVIQAREIRSIKDFLNCKICFHPYKLEGIGPESKSTGSDVVNVVTFR